jgi:hypothetical protein
MEEALLKGEVTFAAAREIGRLYRDPELLEEDDDWLKVARSSRLRDLKRRVRERIESVRQGQKTTVHYSAVVTADTAEDLERCREIATRKAKQAVTKGQMLVVLSTSYLDLHDPLAKKPRKRRMRPTLERPHARGVPAEVVRAIEERSGGLCEFGPCERPSMELCHLTPHREGSGREVDDLAQGCRAHHKAYDAELIRFLGWTDDELPCFIDPKTGEILEPKPRPEARDPANRPDWLVKAIGKRSRPRRKKAPGGMAPAEEAAPSHGRTLASWPHLRLLSRFEHEALPRRRANE